MKRIASLVAVAAMMVGGVSSAFAQTKLDDSQLDNVSAGILNGNFNFSPVWVDQDAYALSYQSQIALFGIQYAENTAKNKSCVDVYVDQTNIDVFGF